MCHSRVQGRIVPRRSLSDNEGKFFQLILSTLKRIQDADMYCTTKPINSKPEISEDFRRPADDSIEFDFKL